jgi:2-methylcitrate dehydratase PrpD
MGATAILAEFAAGTSTDRIPEAARQAALRQVIDCTGVGLAAAVETPGRIIADLTREAGGTPEARVIGSGIATNAVQAAWANGGLCHLLDFDDTGFSHPTACILPAAYAIAERQRSDGRAFMAAVVIGYEVFERLSVSARPYEPTLRARGFHPTSLYGAPAAAAAAGVLLGLDARQMNVALGLSAASSSGLLQHFGTWGKGIQAGTAARAGVTAALMAQKDYWADAEVIEGRYGFFNAFHGEGNFDLSGVDKELGSHWAILDPGLTIKCYPACGATLRAIDAAIALRAEHNLTLDQIERIEMETHPSLLNVVRFHAPEQGFRGKFSFDYCVAAAILDGKVDLDSFSDEACNRPAMRAALAKTTIVKRPEWQAEQRRRNPVTVVFKDGRRVTKEVAHPHGSLQDPLTRDELLAKYHACAARALSPDGVRRSVALLEGIEQVGDMREVISALIGRIPASA